MADTKELIEALQKRALHVAMREDTIPEARDMIEDLSKALAIASQEQTEATSIDRDAEINLGKEIAFEEAARLIEQRNPNEGGREDAAAIRSLKQGGSE